MEDYLERVHQDNERLRASNRIMSLALEKAVALYGQPGGPWNVPNEPGAWLHMAKKALGVE